MQPPWSTATSSTTEPGAMVAIISSVTSVGALAPGSSTAPISNSARRTASEMLRRFEAMVVRLPVQHMRRGSAAVRG